jgi:hypothetical protein
MQEPRSAGALGKDFPYLLSTMCYIEVKDDGAVRWGKDGGTYERARAGTSRLYAVWPGEWSSHLFAIDDLDQYARALGIVHDEERTGLVEHEHAVRWRISDGEDPSTASYVTIEVWLDCGCSVRDLKTFAKHMQTQKGWDVATSVGWGSVTSEGGEQRYDFRIRRKSLTC